MLYKSICLRLLEDRPQVYEQLRQQRQLLPTLERLASELKASHEALMGQLPNDSQIASQSLEIALKELVDSLPTA